MASVEDDQGTALWAVNTVFTVLATFAVMGRFAARHLKKLPLAADDWTIFVALIWDWALYGLYAASRENGLGMHVDVLPQANVIRFMRLLYVYQIIYILGPPTVKLSLLFLYKRVFVSTRFLYMVYGVGASIIVWSIIMTFLAIFMCTPVTAFWTKQGTCLDFKQFAVGYAIVNIITGVTVWLMPIPNVWNVQLPKAQKIALSIIFLLGLFDCAAALVRLFTSMLVLGEQDVTWLYSSGVMWSTIEVSTGIICTCLPTMRVLLKAAFNGKIARALGLSGSGPSQQRSGKRPFFRSNEYSQLEHSWVGKGQSGLNSSHVTTMPDQESTEQGIKVLEEVRVELQPVKPVGLRDA